MTTVKILKKAKEELEAVLRQNNNLLGKALDTPEYRFSQIGRAVAYLDIAIEQEGGDVEVIETDLKMFCDSMKGIAKSVPVFDKAFKSEVEEDG